MVRILFYISIFLLKTQSESSASRLPAAGSDLDYYLDAIVRNSLAVAEKCEDVKRKLRIAKACQEVIVTFYTILLKGNFGSF